MDPYGTYNYGYGYSEEELIQQQFLQQQQLEQQRIQALHQQQVDQLYQLEQQQQQQQQQQYQTQQQYQPQYNNPTVSTTTTTSSYDTQYNQQPSYNTSTNTSQYNQQNNIGSINNSYDYSTNQATSQYNQQPSYNTATNTSQYNQQNNAVGSDEYYGSSYVDHTYVQPSATNNTNVNQYYDTQQQQQQTNDQYRQHTQTQQQQSPHISYTNTNSNTYGQQQQKAATTTTTTTAATNTTIRPVSGEYDYSSQQNIYASNTAPVFNLENLPLPPPPDDTPVTNTSATNSNYQQQQQQQAVQQHDYSEEWKAYYEQQEKEQKAREESWKAYYEQQKQNEVEQERKRLEEMERLRIQHQQEEERLQKELEKQRDEVNRMKEQMRQQLTQQQSQSQMELEQQKQSVIVWHQEEFKRQMIEIQKEKELSKKHEEQTLMALYQEQKLLKDQLLEQQAQLSQQQQSIQQKLQLEEHQRQIDEQKRQQQVREKEELLAKRYKELESIKLSEIESKKKELSLQQQQELERKNKEIQLEKEQLANQKKAMEAENLKKKQEFEQARLNEERKLKEQQDHLHRQKELIDVQQKELKIQLDANKKETIDSLQPMRDLAQVLSSTGISSSNQQSVKPSFVSSNQQQQQQPSIPTSKPPPLPPKSAPPKISQLRQASLTNLGVIPPITAVEPVYRPPPVKEYTQAQLNSVVEGYRFSDIIRAQRCAKKWMSRKKFMNVVSMKLNSHDPETENQKKRFKSVNELYTTEVSYQKSLLILQNFYFIPMEVESKVTKAFKSEEVQKVFSNLRSLLSISTELLTLLEERLSKQPILVGDIFVKLAPIFKIYVEYVNNFDQATPAVKLITESPRGSQFFSEQRKKSRVNTDIHSLLIMPVQRIPRYELLLREILGHTDESHIEYKNIKSGYEAVKSINQYINDRKKNVDNRSKLLELQKEIKNSPELMASHRYYIKEGPVSVASNKKHESGLYYLFLFNDMILCTKKAGIFSSYKYEYVYSIQLKFSDIKDIGAQDSMVRIIVGALDSVDVLIYTISFQTKKEKESWLTELLKETTQKENLIRIQK